MNTALFVDGSLSLGWTAVGGIGGLLPRLAIKGQLIAKGYGIGAVVSITAVVTATDLPSGGNGHLGTTTSRPYVLNWVKQQWVQDNPPPGDETNWDLELHLPMPPGMIEAFEAMRQGKEFWIQLDTTVVMIDRGLPLDDKQRTVHYQVHPTMTWQERMRVTQHDWGEVLRAWDRAASIPLVVPLPETDPHPDRAAIVRYLRDAAEGRRRRLLRIDCRSTKGARDDAAPESGRAAPPEHRPRAGRRPTTSCGG